MDWNFFLAITLGVVVVMMPVTSGRANLRQSLVDEAIPMEDNGDTMNDRMDMFGGGGGGHFPMPGWGSFFGHSKMPFDAISGPYVSSSIGPNVFQSTGPFGGLGIPFSPGPLGGVMGIPLAMLAMG